MKKLSILSALILSIPLAIFSQGVDEAYLLAKENSFGTARSMGMGGAFGALGGDMSAIQINPAGVAVYRASEATFTPSYQWDKATSKYYNTSADDSRDRFTISQLGFVGVNAPMREGATGIISTNYAFNFQRLNDFNTTTQISGINVGSSKLDQFRSEADGRYIKDLDPYGSGLAYATYLLDTLPNYSNNPMYHHVAEQYDANTGNYYSRVNQWNSIQKSGSISEVGGSAGININNKIYLGGSINIDFLKYNADSYYTEYDSDGSIPNLISYDYNTFIHTNGVGLNLKAGIIYKPINALRLGISIQSPTWYTMTDNYNYEISSYVENIGLDKDNNPITGADISKGGYYDYNYTSPYKLCSSIAVILGEKVAISLDYKFIDYSFSSYHATTKNYNEKNQMDTLNMNIKEIYKATNNFNVGIEFKPIPSIALRGGFIYNESGYKNDSNNTLSYTGGIGYRVQNYFIDFAYRLQQVKSTYYPYSLDQSLVNNGYTNEPALITHNTSLAVLTVGVKF